MPDDDADRIAEALDQVVEPLDPDDEAVRTAVAWAAERLVDGDEPPGVVDELVGQGWSAIEAEEMVETARVQTRRERGVVTREDIVRGLNARHSRSTAPLPVAGRAGLFGFIGMFLASLRTFRSLRRRR